ncbi:MAG: hypothetical protein IPF58_18465 [Saprospirales bacterium]|nr:hypothetical protein [Saprospirales bacterium]
MTNTVGTTWTGTIPAASPTNTIVTWSVTATNSLGGTATYTGATYQDDPNVDITAKQRQLQVQFAQVLLHL